MPSVRGLILALFCQGIVAPLSAATYTSIASSDAFVATGPTGNLSANNYGGGGALAVAAPGLPNGEFQSVIRFDLSGARASLDAQYGAGQWSLQSISLQLTSSPHNNTIYNDIAAGRFGVSLMQNSSWTEGTGNASNPSSTGINYNSLQGVYITPGDQALGIYNFDGGTSGAKTYDLNASTLSSAVLSGGIASLRLYAADSSVSYLFSSRAQQPPNQPELLITAVPEPTGLALLAVAAGLLVVRMKSTQRTAEARSFGKVDGL
ncbi:MAG TPA: hypothetical protein VMZ27_10205, partial [Candidatus Saccharimonadales bacterium]|nr:hypothetical protein [Candidatus Saccharimonadales bacterium]